MSFCSFSKEFNENAYTEVENRFISKYLPEADGFYVKVYLYGLYLCQKSEVDFGISAMAEVLGVSEEKIEEAFLFWQDYDLVEVISKQPFAVCYLSARSAVGKPKKVRYEQYADFNKELLRSMQKVGKFVTYNDTVKYMRFLEENEIQPQAFLLIAEYCIDKQGENISPVYIFNKAKKFIKNGKTTYEQVEKELASYNKSEKDVLAIFAVLSIFRKPDESDYSLFNKWTETLGFPKESILAAARKKGRGSMETLDALLLDLQEKGKIEKRDIEEYLSLREVLSSITFKLARKLGVKLGNPAPYIDEYTEKWYNYGFEESSLSDIALYCLKTDIVDFAGMDNLLCDLFKAGIISSESVSVWLKSKNDELKLFNRIQSYCGSLKKSRNNLSLIETWRGWNFSDEMILEAAKRSATSLAPVPYMNKILSDWKHTGVFKTADIPEKAPLSPATRIFENPVIKTLDEKTDRERYYSALRQKAQSRAEKALSKANENPLFKETEKKLSRMEISLAKAELNAPEKLPALQAEKRKLWEEKRALLADMGISEEDLFPHYACKKCNDTGFMKNGKMCDCYKKIAQ